MNVVLCLAAFIVSVFGSGEVTFLHHPKSVSFRGNEIVDQSFLKEVFSASLGFTTSQDSDWPGMRIFNPFHYAEAIVVLVVDGIETLDSVKGHHFALNTDEDEDLSWLTLERRVRNRFPSQNNTLMRVELSDGVDAVAPFYNLVDFENSVSPNVQFLDLNVTEDRDFVSEISLLQEILKKVETGSVTSDGIPDVYWFVLRGLHAVWDLHGDESLATEEAKQLLQDRINQMNGVFKKAYDGSVLISLITSDVSHTRRVRQVSGDSTTTTSPESLYNFSSEYDEDYPVIFNIITWFMVIFVMAILAICVSIMRMDPGRDSIIYRMTTMKSMKKEN